MQAPLTQAQPAEAPSTPARDRLDLSGRRAASAAARAPTAAYDENDRFSTKTRRLLGVHILGEGATELIHIGQAVLNLKGTIDYFIQNTFNYPTLAEAYKIAGLDAWNRMTR